MLTRKEKMIEFETITQSIGHIPTPKDNLYFSDGGNVYFWYSHILQFLKKKSLQAKQEEQEEVTTLLSLTKKTKLKDGDEVGKVEVYLKGEKIHEEPVFVEIKKKRTFLDFLKDLF